MRYRRPTISRFSSPVSASLTAAYWPDRPMRARTSRCCAATVKPPEAAGLALLRGTVEAADGCRAGVGPQKRGEDAHGRSLARAVGPEQCEDGGGGDLEVEAAAGLDRARCVFQVRGARRG